jgi:hypothetical protein
VVTDVLEEHTASILKLNGVNFLTHHKKINVDQSCILYEVGGVTEGLEENKRTEIFKSKIFGLSEM